MATRRFLIRSGADIGRTIAEARTDRGLTQEQLARQIGIDRTALVRLETGTPAQQVDRVVDVLRALGVSLTATMDEGDG